MTNIEFKEKLQIAIQKQDNELLEEAIKLLWDFEPIAFVENEFNQLLLTPNHSQHQYLLKYLQVLRFESSVPYLDQALTQGFDYINYYSGDGVVAKWFSHALMDIGTEEAIAVLKKHAESANEEIQGEMRYRLLKNKLIEQVPYESIGLKLINYGEQQAILPTEGNHFIAHEESEILTFYAAFNDAIANYAVANQRFGGHAFSFSRMTWIKPSFMWMMYRSSWATADNQERILALKIKKSDVLKILKEGVLSSFDATKYTDEAAWKQNLAQSGVRIQWDPDHDKHGLKQKRKAIQIGLKGEVLKAFVTEMILEIEDITSFVKAQHLHKICGDDFLVPQEKVITFNEKSHKVGL
jgi:Domain of unknown function (DUF4291)